MTFTIPNLLDTAVATFPDRLFLKEGDEELSFAAFDQEVRRYAAALRQMGICDGDRVGICMRKNIQQAISIVAVLRANAIFVPILPRLKQDGIEHILRDSGMRIVIVDSARAKEIETIAKSCDIRVLSAESTQDGSQPSLPMAARTISNPEDVFDDISARLAAIIYSSGSTGRPKGIMITHRNLHDGAHIVSNYLSIGPDDRIAGVLSFNFDYGLNQIWQCILTGASLHLHEFFLPNDLFAFLDDHKITVLPVMPVLISRMFNRNLISEDSPYRLDSVRLVCTSGGRVSQAMLDNTSSAFPDAEIFLMYGLTEAFRSTYLPPAELAKRPGSIGKAIPDVELLVLDENGEDCPPGVKGELVHRGGCIARGYWNDPERTAERFRAIDRFPGETVVFSGDLVSRDEDGYLYFSGRHDELIKSHGYRISPSEIEDAAMRHEDIAAAVAFGIVNIEIGDEIVLVYTSRSGEPLARPLLLNFFKRELPNYMVPAHLVHFTEFSATGNEGKIDRQSVVARARAEIAED